MCLEIAEDEFQWACVVGLISETVDETNLPSPLVDLQRVRINQPRVQNSVVSIVSQELLDMPYCRRFSPMSMVEKSNLLEKVRLIFPQGHDERLIVDKILHLVRSDESLSPLNLKALKPELQGLILFLTHNDSPSRVLELKQTDFEGLTSAGLMIAVFIVGLRFRRQMLQSDQVFVPFRNMQILKVVAMLNGSTLPESSEVHRAGDKVFINDVLYQRRSKFFAFEIPINDLIVYAGLKSDFSKFGRVKLIAIKNLSSIGSTKIIEILFPKNNEHDAILKRISFEDSKEGKIKVFKNRPLLDKYFYSEAFLEIRFKGEVRIQEYGESLTKLENVLLRIRLKDLDKFKVEVPEIKKVKKNKSKKKSEDQLSFLKSSEVIDQSTKDEKKELIYWKKEFKFLFKNKSIKF